jgi:N-acetylglucosaminyldiphosphoundecaprenol N-acetyl-beta-D-mannosaminyltransferase
MAPLADLINKKVVSLNIDLIDYKEAIDKIIVMGRNKRPGYACFANVHMAIEAYRDPKIADQVNSASFVFADGMPLVKSLKYLYGIKQDRIAGMDFMPDLIRESAISKLKIFFFGTTTDLLEKISVRVESEYPNAEIVGLLSPPFDKSLDDELYINTINASGANLVFVALGCPKQEKWMAKHSARIDAVLLGVGGAFPVYAGTASRAPLFMRKLALEWLYRLFQEPTRLFKRYFVTNTMFVYLLFREKMKLILTNK